MTTAVALGAPHEGNQYGVVELKAVYFRYRWWGLAIAVAIHAAIIGSYYVVDLLQSEEPPTVRVRILNYRDLGPPPSITSTNVPPPVSASAPSVRPKAGVPVPVPEAEVSPDQTLATQPEMSAQDRSIVDPTGGSEVSVQGPPNIEDEAPPAEFVPVQKDPVVVKKVEPRYPELAMRAGLEGKVYVKIWVDKEGKARQVVVLTSTAEIFNEPAIEAAKQFVFTPAYMNNGPVSVWVSVPFKFRLADRK